MLKACWDCINANRVQADNEVSYGTRLNGDTQRAPPWPSPQLENENMFLLPRKLNSGDRIDVSGEMKSSRQGFTVNLITGYSAPDYGNIACQLEVRFGNEDRVTIRIIKNGYNEEINGDYQSTAASQWFADTSFSFGFTLSINTNYNNGPLLDVYIGESFMEQVNLKHNIDEIRFLSLNGDIEKVNKLDFQFA